MLGLSTSNTLMSLSEQLLDFQSVSYKKNYTFLFQNPLCFEGKSS